MQLRLTALVSNPMRLREMLFLGTSVATAVLAPTPALRVATSAVLAVAFAAYLILTRGPERLHQPALIVAAAGTVASMLLSHNGVGEAPLLMCAIYPRLVFPATEGKVVTWLIGIAFGISIAWISRNPVGLLAGLGVPVLALRRQEQILLRQEHARTLTLLAELEAARDAQAEAAALQERGRIAREMHDVLAHSLSGLSLQLQATRAVAQREGVSPAVMQPLERAAELARSGVEEAKAVVGALRGTADDGATRGLGDLPSLVERFPGSAELSASGEPQQVSAEAGHAIFRAVQESLTNAARYAPGSPVRVKLAWEPDRLQVCVDDEGAGDHPVAAGQGTGQGLRGMGERLAAIGAQLHAGPRQRGWRTEVVVPLTAVDAS